MGGGEGHKFAAVGEHAVAAGGGSDDVLERTEVMVGFWMYEKSTTCSG